jgi:RNA polymerase sigma-70 factor, ECF subfamily
VVSRPRDESELVERARRGDENAYEELVRAHQGIAFRTAYLVVGSAAEAEEAAQEGFIKAYRALGRFRPGSPFRPWLLQIVANEARNRRRSEGRRAALALRAAAEAPTGRRRIEGRAGFAGMADPQSSSGGAAPSPEGALVAGEDRQRLLEAVNGLREEERLVIACRFFLELSEEETAAALGVRPGTVKSRTSRALEHLRESYG